MLGSGGYCQHTEGFGEMALRSGTADQGGQRRNGFPFLLLLLSRSANSSYEVCTRIPPAPSVVNLSRPVAASIASTRPALCDAILGTCDAEDRCGFAYFFFRRLVVFFAAAFFAFLFFAIAALLA